MLTATADFHHFRPFGVLAVFAAVFTVLFGGTVACAMRTFSLVLFSHNGLFFSLKFWGTSGWYARDPAIQSRLRFDLMLFQQRGEPVPAASPRTTADRASSVRSPTVRKGELGRANLQKDEGASRALPYGRASDTTR